MSILSDSHVHSYFSTDSEAPMESVVQTAIAKGMKIICFTDHNDFDYPSEQEEPEFLLNVDSYLYELLKIREKYKDQISVRFGIELGIDDNIIRKNLMLAKSHEFDFIIGSSHVVHGVDPYYPAFFEGRDEKAAYREYFESILSNVKAFNYYDVYGHLDYVVRYGPTKNENYAYADYKDVIDEILKHLIENEKGIEINSGGYRKGLGQPNPCIDILKRYHELGGEIVTLGSDAHVPEDLQDHFEEMAEILRSVGFKYHAVYENRLPEFFKL